MIAHDYSQRTFRNGPGSWRVGRRVLNSMGLLAPDDVSVRDHVWIRVQVRDRLTLEDRGERWVRFDGDRWSVRRERP